MQHNIYLQVAEMDVHKEEILGVKVEVTAKDLETVEEGVEFKVMVVVVGSVTMEEMVEEEGEDTEVEEEVNGYLINFGKG